jgi:hypothetical protein
MIFILLGRNKEKWLQENGGPEGVKESLNE